MHLDKCVCTEAVLWFVCWCSRVSVGFPSPASAGSRRAPRSELRRRPSVPFSLRPGVHRVPGHGRVCPSVVCCNQEGPDGLSDQETSRCGRYTVRQGKNLSAGEMCGQNSQETLFGKFAVYLKFISLIYSKVKQAVFFLQNVRWSAFEGFFFDRSFKHSSY